MERPKAKSAEESILQASPRLRSVDDGYILSLRKAENQCNDVLIMMGWKQGVDFF